MLNIQQFVTLNKLELCKAHTRVHAAIVLHQLQYTISTLVYYYNDVYEHDDPYLR